jgi:hypothetical protein
MSSPEPGGTHATICDPAFDAGHCDDGAGGNGDGCASPVRGEPRQALQEAQYTCEPRFARFPAFRSGLGSCQTAQRGRRSLSWRHSPKLRVRQMAASDRGGSRSRDFRLFRRLIGTCQPQAIPVPCPNSGGTHEQIYDFDSGHLRDIVGSGSDDKTSRRCNEQQPAHQEASKEDVFGTRQQRSAVWRPGVVRYKAFQSDRPGLPRHCPKLRLCDLAASHG